MTNNKMFQLHPARCQKTGKGWQVTGKVRLWQERNGAEKGEFEYIYTYTVRNLLVFVTTIGTLNLWREKWWTFISMTRTNCIYLSTVT
jgi:hypothetical protein